jgi:RNA recognition motif-containing protein
MSEPQIKKPPGNPSRMKMSVEEESGKRGRKRSPDEAELEIDVNAPEPPSKKALRKAKKQKTAGPGKEPNEDTDKPKAEDVDLKRLNGLEGERSKHGVWIGNLAFTVGKKDVYKFLTENNKFPIPGDQITRLHLPPGRDSRAQNKGFAYVDFKEEKWVGIAVQLSETLLTGRPLLIKDSHNFEGRPDSSKTKAFQDAQAKPPNRKLFIGNLPFDMTRENLEKHFSRCGPILKTQVATFEDSGKCKGYAWIEFEELSAAEQAMRGQVTIDAPTAPTGKKTIYLGRYGDSKLRMEYAEDATSRYNKRFGKTVKEEEAPIREVDDSVAVEEASAHTSKNRREKPSGTGDRRRDSKKKERREDNSRYGTETVQKLTGAIVESQGKKVTFD